MNAKKTTDLISVQPEMLGYVDKADIAHAEYYVLVEMGLGVNEVKTYAQWLLGKLGDAVSDRYGDLVKYAKDIGYIYSSLKQYVFVYRQYTRSDPNFSPDKYYGHVPWGMLQVVASQSDAPINDLDELVDKGVTSIEGAYRGLKEKQTGITVPRKPSIRLIWNNEIGKWRMALAEKDLDLIDWSNVKQQLLEYLRSLE